MHQQTNLLSGLNHSDKIWHLSRASLVAGLEPEDLEAIARHMKDRIYGESEVIFEAGTPAEALFVLNRGSVRLSIASDPKRERTVEILRGGDIFGLEAIREGGVYLVEAAAHEESWVSTLRKGDFITLARERPVLSNNLIQLLLERLADAHADIKALCFLDIQQRLVQTLLKLCERHGQRLASQHNIVRLKLKLTHDFLARLTGANRPYLSNIMSRFKKEGWIRYQRHHLLIEVDALANLAPLSENGHRL
jgi:CRP-like cAMP-binding protein